MSIIKRLLGYTRPYTVRLGFGISSMVIHSLVTVFVFQVFKDFIDSMITDINGSSALDQLTLLSVSFVAVFLVKGFAYYGQRYLTTYVAQRTMKDIRDSLYKHLQSLSLAFYDKHRVGQVMSRVVNDVTVLESDLVSGVINIFYNLMTLIAGVGYLIYLNPRLTLLMLVILPAIIYTFRIFSNKIRIMSKRIQQSVADINDVLHEGLVGIRIVKSFVREDYEFARFTKQNQANFSAARKNAQLVSTLSPVVELLAAIGFSIVLWFGGYEVVNEKMTPGELIAFFTLALLIVNPLKSLSGLSHTIQRATAAAERIFELLDVTPTITEAPDAISLSPQINGAISFKNVSFAYDPGRPVLEDINLDIKPGEMVALVGSSGAGKSTLVDLIPRFYEVTEGAVLVDGHNVKELTLASLRETIGIVPQETFVFSGTVAQNIRYGRLGAVDTEVIAAAKAANAHEFIQDLANGYETEIGESGSGLSGGQKQRIAIARAILKNPRILILDEATSALDTESEALVQEALERLMEGRTTIVIAHRLSTIQKANRIIVLDKGRIAESGTHDELLARNGIYRNLYQVQFNAD